MTISSDMTDDALFTDKLRDGTYQFAVMHFKPEGDEFFCKKCGHEDLFISLVDAECHADYYLVCLDSEKSKYKKLFDCIRESTII